MEMDKTMRFYKLYAELASLTQIVNQKPDIPRIENILNEIAALYRLSKGVTRFFRNPGDEERGVGETMISYDTGKEGDPVHTVRFVTRLMSITTMTVYMAKDEPPLTEDELSKVDLTMRTALAFISRNRLQVIAEDLAFFDDMGFRNIRSFFNYITWRGKPGGFDNCVAMDYNLRHFSLINEELGHDLGDVVLRKHYEMVTEMIGTDGILARLGGDSFVCICRKETLSKILDFLTEGEIFYEEGKSITVSACAGVFVIPNGYTVNTPNDVMGRIIRAFVAAKNGNQGNVVFFNESLFADREKSKRIQQQFPEAMKKGQIRVFYQPKVNTFTGEICGAEALCRWIRDDRIVPPMEFIPALEETSDICRLDFFVLELVCENMRKWIDEGRTAVRVSVNLSRKHEMDERLLRSIIQIVDKYQVPHEKIEIELTENTKDVEFKDLQRIVTGLQAEGIVTSVDDFGMGYSSLNLIRVIPWNVLKVDRTFLPVDGEDPHSFRSIMFRHVVAMVKEMGLECIVEGVETPTQLKVLTDNLCEQAQGFLFDKPLPIEEFEKRLDRKKYSLEY